MAQININTLIEKLKEIGIRDRIFAQIGEEKILYGRLQEEVDKLHVIFQQNGIKKGTQIILSTSDDYYTTLFFIAFLQYGIVTILIDPDVPPIRAKGIIQKSITNIFVMDENLFITRGIDTNSTSFYLKIQNGGQKKGKLLDRLLKRKREIIITDKFIFPEILNEIFDVPLPTAKIEEEDLAYILFTSGTTTDPKGVMISHKNLFSHLHTLKKVYGLNEESRILNILMLYHADGIIQGPLLSIFNLATWIRPFRFNLSNIEDLFNSIYKFRITHFITVPTILSFMNKFHEGYEDSFQTEDFKFIISVASKLEIKLWQDFEDKFHTQIVNVYGLTETVAGSLFSGLNSYNRKLGSVGVPIDCEAKIIKEDGTLAHINEPGILWLKGQHIFNGYLNNHTATITSLQNEWLNTGDISTQDNEGFYYIIGREKNTINTGGINIYPEQVTEMVNSHPQVLESICFGIDDENFQEKLVCALILVPGAKLNKSDLIAYLRPLLEVNQMPKNFHFFDQFPKGLSGKIQICEIKKVILSIEDSVTKTDTIKIDTAIIEIAAEVFGIDKGMLNMSDSSYNLDGWDSMAHLVFITFLEKKFSLHFSTAEMMNMNSLVAAEKIINEKIKKNNYEI